MKVTLFLSLGLTSIAFLFFSSFPVYAATYGSGKYGEGKYGIGAVPTSAPSSNNNSGSSSNNSSACTIAAPSSAPDLFQINTKSTDVTLYFAPSTGEVNKYFISYGYSAGDQRFGVEFNQGKSTGALAYTINALAPNTTYYFRVRGGNGCMPGGWSNEMKVTTLKKGSKTMVKNYKSWISRIVNTILPKKTTDVTPKNVAPKKAAVTTGKTCEYVVESGDSLYKIAGVDYGQIVELNKKTYPSLSISTLIRPGWKLQVGC